MNALSADQIDVPGWRLTRGALKGTFATDGFSAGARFLQDVAKAADEANHHPDALVTYPSVEFTLVTHDADDTVTDKDVALARRINDIAGALSIKHAD
ncbi:4a-hydroxytetrahydrobiopterin dehydratase [Calidifontibacter sp. DB0510]|uniref:Putative pterin-4-alpha-carbinolamine dehydratase n=1 Tax=Metallococcus carri TaxID=1656884 RepID=A0A967B4W4_9MICO|nr:4a-hydroxytetrahydrobiopterin dehydratase [Metallococcus carri]NHN57325.1 4a-hydroxytetrahydrobiopterin dehydratase [Metallococcus carri]NOP38070.1 4a-hydroxytetrahydrobiopterin dehydratase [Calidifontibacter sp. DB2511S]